MKLYNTDDKTYIWAHKHNTQKLYHEVKKWLDAEGYFDQHAKYLRICKSKGISPPRKRLTNIISENSSTDRIELHKIYPTDQDDLLDKVKAEIDTMIKEEGAEIPLNEPPAIASTGKIILVIIISYILYKIFTS